MLRPALVAAGIALVTFGVADGVDARGPTKRKVTLLVHNTDCQHEVEAKVAKLEKKKEDALGLRIRNECGIQRRAIVCVYDATGKRANPFGACTSAPSGTGLATSFTLAPNGGTKDIDCPAQQEGRYTAVVLVGDAVRPAGCPATIPKDRLLAAGERTFNHRLAVEIVP